MEKIDFPMTRERYLATWKIFRTISDENLITAKHILSLKSWKNVQSILDLGCGDGLIAKHIVLNNQMPINKAVLIDPDWEMLEEAYMHLKEIEMVHDLIKELSGFEYHFEKYVSDADVVLAVHLVYLITQDKFHFLIDRLPLQKKLVLILDDEDSIFTKLWSRTAPKYFERSSYVRNYLNTPNDDFLVQKTTITSKISDPLSQREEVKDALLSLMSYSDYSLMDETSRCFVEQAVKGNLSDGYLTCNSACYEICKIY